MKDQLKISEYTECLTLVDYLETLKTQGKVKLFTHIAQETFTKSWAVKAKNKRMGVRRGFPDYVIITRKGVIYIEMKAKKGKASVEQLEWIEALPGAYICYGYDQAKDIVDNYI